jgi:hypothetical protein
VSIGSRLKRPARGVRKHARRLAALMNRATVATPSPDGRQPKNVLFVGGTSRSGSSITARLIGDHPAYARIPIETKFLTAPGGLCDLADRRTGYREFEAKILGRWFYSGPGRGLHVMTDKATLEAGLSILRQGLASDPWTASRRFTHALFDPIADAANAPGWVEKHPPNVRKAHLLIRMFPNMRLVHVVRDGRDVVCSVLTFDWGASELSEGLDWWAERLERGFAACERLPRGRVHVVQMEDLVSRDRDREYGRLLAFLELEDDPAMHARFVEGVTEEKAHMGRWRHDVPAELLPSFEAHHERLAAELWKRQRPYTPISMPLVASSA